MATVAAIVTVVMGFLAAMLLFNATVTPPRNKRRENGKARDEHAYRERQRTMRTLGLVAAVVAVIAAYVAALAG
jgi:hypothetical protein